MKNKKKILLVLIMIITMMSSYFIYTRDVSKADEYEDLLGDPSKVSYAKDMFELSASEILSIYAANSTGKSVKYRYSVDVSTPGIVLIPFYGGRNHTNQETFQDGMIDATDASNVLAYGNIGIDLEIRTLEDQNRIWRDKVADVADSIMYYYSQKGKEMQMSDIKVTVDYRIPDIPELGISDGEYDFSLNTVDGYTADIVQKVNAINEIFTDENLRNMRYHGMTSRGIIRITAETSDGRIFKAVVGSDDNIYFLEPKSITVTPDFKTEMSYTSAGQTTADDGNVFLPQYKENDNPSKDLDVTVTIKSKTGDYIMAIGSDDENVQISKEPNKFGWYYPDENDKTVIAKDYPFDEYDNTTYNGEVSEEVTLVAANDEEDVQKPHIKWTFRRKTKDENENSDGSLTEVITYNLPVDKDSIPNDWEPIYDEDGATIHKITKTIKKGDNYKKDVTVKQFGGDATVTTTVEKVWTLPKTGDIWTFAAIGLVVLIAFTISRRRKMSKILK